MLNFKRKFIWGSADFENELRKISEKIKKEKGVIIYPSELTHLFAESLKKKQIDLELSLPRFRAGGKRKLKIKY